MLLSKSMRSAVVVLLAFSLGACSEGLTAPPGAGLDPSGPLMAKGNGNGGGKGGSNAVSESGGRGKDAGSRTFTILPGEAVLEKFGDHILTMPANVICDPATSGYGRAYWDSPCARITRPIEVTATWSTHNGRPAISFSPHLRFAPSKNEQQWVELSLRDPKNINPDRYYTILWFDAEARRWVDESLTDETLKARANHVGNLITRRVKHFSDYTLWSGFGSYNVTSGFAGDDSGLGGW